MLGDKTGLASSLKEDLFVGEQREAEQAELDEQDEFQAEESSRMKRSLGQAGRRPKTSRTLVERYVLVCSLSVCLYVCM